MTDPTNRKTSPTATQCATVAHAVYEFDSTEDVVSTIVYRVARYLAISDFFDGDTFHAAEDISAYVYSLYDFAKVDTDEGGQS